MTDDDDTDMATRLLFSIKQPSLDYDSRLIYILFPQ